MKKTMIADRKHPQASVQISHASYPYAQADPSNTYQAYGSARRKAGTGRAAAVEIVRGHRIAIADTFDANTAAGRIRTRTEERLLSLRVLLLILLMMLAAGAAAVLMLFNFRHAVINGSTKYSQEQIESLITDGTLGRNTLVMALKYHQRAIRDVPFIDRIDIDIVNPSTVRVNIREKELDGVIACGERNIYISCDGTVQTISGRSFEDVTKITGVSLDEALVTGEQAAALDEDNRMKLDLVIQLLQAVEKYDLQADAVESDTNGNLTARFGRVRVKLGKTGYDQKIRRIHQIESFLEGRRGVISMTGYSCDGDIVLSPR